MQETKRFVANKCGCCGQTTEYEIALDRGTAMIVLAVYNAVRIKDLNRVNLTKEMECNPRDFKDYKEMVMEGRISSWMKGNVLRAKYHGLLAQVDGGGANEYLITPKGSDFLFRNAQVPRIAIIDKVTHTKSYYLNELTDQTTFGELMRKEVQFWNFNEATICKIFPYYQRNVGQAALAI